MKFPVLLLTILVLLGCSENESGVFVDSRDKQKYKVVEIGDYVWMARNLNYNTGDSLESWCYENNGSYCKKYGRLYNWEAAMQSCPGGWHLPNDEEWNNLAQAAGGWRFAANALKSKSGWKEEGHGNGTDSLSFSALPGGGSFDDGFSYIDNRGFWWSATEDDKFNAYDLIIYSYHGDLIRSAGIDKSLGRSVRCVKDYNPDSLSAIQARKFELLTLTSVEFKTYGRNCFECNPRPWQKISVEKTAAGTIVKYKRHYFRTSETEAELSAEEWQNFIKAIYALNIGEWKRDYNSNAKYGKRWRLAVSGENNVNLEYKGHNRYPPNFEELEKLMDSMRAKMKKKLEMPTETNLKMEYEEKFREPISDFELSTMSVLFDFKGPRHAWVNGKEMTLSVFRTETGANAYYEGYTTKRHYIRRELELNAEEWQNFIRALYKLRVNEWDVNEWKEKYGDSKNIESWNLEIWSSNKNKPDSLKNNSTFPPNWKEFKKLIDDMAAKVKNKGKR